MSLGCDSIVRGNTSNRNDNIMYVSALGLNTSTNQVTMYRMPAVAPEAGTFPLGQMFSGARDKNSIYDTTGRYSSTLGNETVEERSFSLSFASDTIYNALNPDVLPSTVSKNTMVAMLEGSYIDDGGTKIELISTSGARLNCDSGVTNPITNAKYLFYRDGYFVIDGKRKEDGAPKLRPNPDIVNYNKTEICSMMEVKVSPDADGSQDEVFRFPFVGSNNVQFAEGDDANSYSADCMAICDRRHTDQLIAEGFSGNEVDEVATSGTTSIYKVNADYIITVAGGGTPTVAGTTGDIAIVINSTDDTVEIYKHDSTSWDNTAVTSVLGKGFVAWTDEMATSLDGTGGTSGNVGFMTVATAGATGVAVAGKSGDTYLIPVKTAVVDDFDRDSGFWTAYTTA